METLRAVLHLVQDPSFYRDFLWGFIFVIIWMTFVNPRPSRA